MVVAFCLFPVLTMLAEGNTFCRLPSSCPILSIYCLSLSHEWILIGILTLCLRNIFLFITLNDLLFYFIYEFIYNRNIYIKNK